MPFKLFQSSDRLTSISLMRLHRTWNSHYQFIKVKTEAKHAGAKVGVSFLPRGKKFKAATLGGWGLAVNKFNLSKGNECRKSTSAKSLRALANLSTQEYFFSQFQRYPTFNSTYMTKICKTENGTYETSQIACLLTRIQSSDQNRIRKLVTRPLVLKHYHKKSKIIYEFVSTFLALQAKRQEVIEADVSVLSTMLNASNLLRSMTCLLEKSIMADKMAKPSEASRPCMCGQSSVCDKEQDYSKQFLSGSKLILRKHKRTENNILLLFGDKNCMHNYNFVNSFTFALGIIFLVLIYGMSLILFVWILRNLKHTVINHSQPVFLIIVLLGVCCNVSTIVPFLIDESSVSSCQKLNLVNNASLVEESLYEQECQQQLDVACRSIPFLYMYGFVMTYSALLTKLWRVEKIFNNKKLQRLKINQSHLMLLIAFFIALVTLINLYFISGETFADGQGWVWWRMKVKSIKLDPLCSFLPRFTDNSEETFCNTYLSEVQINSIGMCRRPPLSCEEPTNTISIPMIMYLVIIASFLCYSLYIAVKTRNIKTSYNEGKFILISLVNQSQLIMIFVAVMGQVGDSSSPQNSATYKAFVCFIVGISNLSTLCFIFAPKLIVYYDPVKAGKSFRLKRIVSEPAPVLKVTKSEVNRRGNRDLAVIELASKSMTTKQG